LMGLSLLYPMLTALIRAARPSAQIGLLTHVLIAAALCLYTLSVAYSGGYHPWFGDSAMPGTRETLAMVCFMGYILAFEQDRRALILGAALMSYLSIPTGGLWLLAWPLAVLLVWRPVERGRLIFSVWVLIGAASVAVLLPVLVRLLDLPLPGGEFNASAVVQRLRFVAFTDWNRIAFLAVPIGIVPVLAIATWRWQDQISKALILLSVAFFLFFYLQGYRILLHHFIPAMFPLLVAMWRSPPMSHALGKGAVCLGLLAGLWLALPKDASVQGYDREFGGFIATEGPRFAHGDPKAGAGSYGYDPRAVDTVDVLLIKLFPIGLTDSAPAESFFGAPLTWWHYSEFPKSADQAINYVIKPVTAATAVDGALFAAHDGYGLYIRDMALFEKHKKMRLPYDNGAPILATKRSVIFGGGAKWTQSWSDRHVIDLVAIAKRLLGVN
ncbi:MAG: hypothetical protein WBH04_14410, partial [Albidovulum sp.]